MTLSYHACGQRSCLQAISQPSTSKNSTNLVTWKEELVIMGQTVIHRRRFLAGLASTICCAAAGRWRWSASPHDLPDFYVAGVRFNRMQTAPKLNERVLIRSSKW